MSGLDLARSKMREAQVSPQAIAVFSYYYHQLESQATGVIREDSIIPFANPLDLVNVKVTDTDAQKVLDKTVIIKLNGGLGTSMGLNKAKSLLEIRNNLNFLDIIVQQVLSIRDHYQVRLPLIFMNSFRTRDDTLKVLAKYPQLKLPGIPLDFLQSLEPKLRADDLHPVHWPKNPELEWCPPGHGDLYTTLLSSGILDILLDQGFRYASTSNCDNLGASPNPTIAGWFASTEAPYAAELCRRTINDKKGGHLAIRKSDGQLILRDTAQTAPEEMHYFTDEFRHPFFHTNNLWFDLVHLKKILTERDSILGLPLIRNEKNVDPTDKNSPKIIQIESAIGTAIEVFKGASAICVARDRFLPVKTTNELILLRSDLYELSDNGFLIQTSPHIPAINLCASYYQTIDDFDRRIPYSVSLREAKSLTVEGDWTFGRNVKVIGDIKLGPTQDPQQIPDGTILYG